MNKVRIITDSASDFIVTDQEQVTVLPMTVRFGDQEYMDGVNLSHKEFYEKLVESDELPVTSLVSPGVFAEAYEKAVQDGEQVVVITVSSKLSGTYQSAMLAAAEYDGEVFVVDSLNVSVAEQAIVRYAVRLAEEGKTAAEIAAILEEAKEKMHIVALLDTLEYLKKGGRISKSIAFVGGILSIKPIVSCKDGEVAMLGTARGSKNGNNFLIKEIEKTKGIDFTKPIGLGYTGLDDSLLRKYIKDSAALWTGHDDCLSISTIGATIGTHIGPGAIAVAFFSL